MGVRREQILCLQISILKVIVMMISRKKKTVSEIKYGKR